MKKSTHKIIYISIIISIKMCIEKDNRKLIIVSVFLINTISCGRYANEQKLCEKIA